MTCRFYETEAGDTLLLQKISHIEKYNDWGFIVFMDTGRKISITDKDNQNIQHMLLDELCNERHQQSS